jgi:ABC-type transporter Mla subunit MlaD
MIELEALKVIAMQGGGVVGVIAVVLIFLKHSSKQATQFTDTLLTSQATHAEQMTKLVDDHVVLTKETVKAVGKLDATVRSVERTVLGVEATVGELRNVVTILSREHERSERREDERNERNDRREEGKA